MKNNNLFLFYSMAPKYDILRIKDKFEDSVIRKKVLFDMPFRILLVAKTGQGKTLTILNWLLRNQ